VHLVGFTVEMGDVILTVSTVFVCKVCYRLRCP